MNKISYEFMLSAQQNALFLEDRKTLNVQEGNLLVKVGASPLCSADTLEASLQGCSDLFKFLQVDGSVVVEVKH